MDLPQTGQKGNVGGLIFIPCIRFKYIWYLNRQNKAAKAKPKLLKAKIKARILIVNV